MHNFKQAFKTTFCFLLTIAVISFGLMELYFKTANYYYQDSEIREELAGTIDYAISGASHGMRAFNSAIIDDKLNVNSYNLCGSRMTMKGRYDILKEELERNPVRTVIVEVSYDAMSRDRKEEGPEGDIYMLGRINGIPERLKFFFSTFYPSEYPRMYYDTLSRGCYGIVCAINGQFKTAQTATVQGYYPYSEPDLGVPALTESLYDSEELDTSICDYNREYLNKILDLCEEHGVKTILATTPLSEYTIYRCSNLDEFYNYYSELAEERNIAYYDFNLLKNKTDLFKDDVSFYDEAHLNNTGADTFTSILCDTLLKADNGENVKDNFYSSYQEKKTQN